MTDGHRTSTIPRPAVTDAPATRFDQKSRTSTDGIARDTSLASRDDDDDDDDDDRLLKDFTSSIPRAKQIIPQRRGRLVIGLFAAIISLAIGASLFVLPVKSWMKQRDDLATRNAELKTLDAANAELQNEVTRLQTTAGILEAAREEIDYVAGGEKRVTVQPVGPASTTLPAGWPYNLVTSIIAIRQAELVESTAPATTATPATTTAATTTAATTSAATTTAATTTAATTSVPTTSAPTVAATSTTPAITP